MKAKSKRVRVSPKFFGDNKINGKEPIARGHRRQCVSLSRHLVVLMLLVHVISYVAATTNIEIPAVGFKTGSSAGFVYVSVSVYWKEAAYICEQEHNGHLVRFNSQDEKDRLKQFMSDFSIPHHFWIGLQWHNSQTDMVWDDGSCTSKTSWYNFDTNSDSVYSSSRECFMEHSTSDPMWENEKCSKQKEFVCQKSAGSSIIRETRNIVFYAILQRDSTLDTCGDLCASLDDCFMTSSIGHGCVVGLVSDSGDTLLIKASGVAGEEVSNIAVSYSHIGSGAPGPCQKRALSSGQTPLAITPLSDYTLINGTWSSESAGSCPAVSTPEVSQVQVTETFTVTETPAGGAVVSITVTETETETETETITDSIYVTTQIMTTITPTVVMATPSSCPSVSATPAQPQPTPAQVQTPPLPTALIDVPLKALDVSTLSKTIRSKTSATNKKTSSKILGFIVSLPFFILFSAMIGIDIFTRLLVDFRSKFLCNVQQRFRGFSQI